MWWEIDIADYKLCLQQTLEETSELFLKKNLHYGWLQEITEEHCVVIVLWS